MVDCCEESIGRRVWKQGRVNDDWQCASKSNERMKVLRTVANAVSRFSLSEEIGSQSSG
jgi:hypothetical protein